MNKNDNTIASQLYSISLRRRVTKNFVEITLLLMTIIILLPLFSILVSILSQGLPIIFSNFPSYFELSTAGASDTSYGIINALIGSMVIVLTASFFSIPIGIFSGIYLAEAKSTNLEAYTKKRSNINIIISFVTFFILIIFIGFSLIINFIELTIIGIGLLIIFLIPNKFYSSSVRLIADVLQSTPSIVAGLVIFIFWVLPRKTEGYGALAGGMALAILMIPIITRVTEEGIRTVPQSINEAAISLGIPEWRIMMSIIVRSAGPIILTGIMLSIARISGETAPLLFTVGDTNFNWGWNNFTPTLTIKIFKYATSPFLNTWVPSAWGMASILLSFVFFVNIIIRTNILGKLWQNPINKVMLSEFAIVGLLVSINALFGDIVLMLVIGLTFKYLLFNELMKSGLLAKLSEKKLLRIPLGNLLIIVILAESLGEILLFSVNYLINIIYVINYRFSMVIVILGVIVFLRRYIKQKHSATQIINLFIEISFGLLLLEIATFKFGGSNYFIGDIVYFILLFSIFLRLGIYKILLNRFGEFETLWKNKFAKYIITIEILEVTIQVILFTLHFFLNIVFHLNIYLLINYIYVLNNLLCYVLLSVLIMYYIVDYFIGLKTTLNRVRSLVVIFGALNFINFVFPLADELFTLILLGILLKSVIIFVILRKNHFNSIKGNLQSKLLYYIVIAESLFELLLFVANNNATSRSIVFNLDYILILFLICYFFYSLLLHYKIIKPKINTYV